MWSGLLKVRFGFGTSPLLWLRGWYVMKRPSLVENMEIGGVEGKP